jgi:hypothetical protein
MSIKRSASGARRRRGKREDDDEGRDGKENALATLRMMPGRSCVKSWSKTRRQKEAGEEADGDEEESAEEGAERAKQIFV